MQDTYSDQIAEQMHAQYTVHCLNIHAEPEQEDDTYARIDLTAGIVALIEQWKGRNSPWFTSDELDDIAAKALAAATEEQVNRRAVKRSLT